MSACKHNKGIEKCSQIPSAHPENAALQSTACRRGFIVSSRAVFSGPGTTQEHAFWKDGQSITAYHRMRTLVRSGLDWPSQPRLNYYKSFQQAPAGM